MNTYERIGYLEDLVSFLLDQLDSWGRPILTARSLYDYGYTIDEIEALGYDYTVEELESEED